MTIPDGVTSIGNLAFYNCTGLQSVTIPTGVTRIGYQAFFNCPGLQSVTIPGTVMNIRNNAFGYDKNYNRVPGFTIYGYTGTDAERYANEFGFVFVSSGEFHYTPDFSCVTIAGTGSGRFLYGESWDPTSELNRMTKVSTGVYEITYFAVYDGFDYQLEFVANTNWDLSWGCVPEDGFASGITKSAVWNSQSIPFTPKLGTGTVDVRITFDIKDWNNPTYRIDIVPQGESFDIYNHNLPDRLIISKTPDKIRYFPGEAFDPTGMIVTAVFNDGTEQQVTDYTLIPMEAQGSVQQLIVSWRNKTTLLTIFVFALGDVNLDGAVTIADVTLIQRALVELAELDESERQLADFNQDGEISIADATLIQIQISQ